MSESSVFQNIGNVLSRIDEIKRTYGVNKTVEYPGFDYWLDREMQIEQEEDAVENLQVDKSDKEIAPAPDTPLIKDMDSNSGTKEDAEQNTDMFNDIIREASKRFMVPEQLISAVIKQESDFDQTAVSPKGAMGLMQLMPATAVFLGVEDPFNAGENIFGGTKYLRELINRYNGNLNKALAAYNAGPRRVGEDIPDIPETKDFIQSVLDYYDAFSKYD